MGTGVVGLGLSGCFSCLITLIRRLCPSPPTLHTERSTTRVSTLCTGFAAHIAVATPLRSGTGCAVRDPSGRERSGPSGRRRRVVHGWVTSIRKPYATSPCFSQRANRSSTYSPGSSCSSVLGCVSSARGAFSPGGNDHQRCPSAGSVFASSGLTLATVRTSSVGVSSAAGRTAGRPGTAPAGGPGGRDADHVGAQPNPALGSVRLPAVGADPGGLLQAVGAQRGGRLDRKPRGLETGGCRRPGPVRGRRGWPSANGVRSETPGPPANRRAPGRENGETEDEIERVWSAWLLPP